MHDTTEQLLYLLIALEFILGGAYYFSQWKKYNHRRNTDLLVVLSFIFVGISNGAWGMETICFAIFSPIGYIADFAVSGFLFLFFINKFIDEFWRDEKERFLGRKQRKQKEKKRLREGKKGG